MTPAKYTEKYKMKIWWRGHASFYIEVSGYKIITDPFNLELGYPMIRNQADIVTVSHDHWDHNAVDTILGNPKVILGTGATEIAGIKLQGIASFHDRHEGRERGTNTIFKITADGLTLVHLGDLGQMLTDQQAEKIAPVDILLVPVGGNYTIDARQAVTVVNKLQPKVAIPMHYSTPHLSFPLAPVEEFTFYYDQVTKKPYLDVEADQLAVPTRIIVLEYLSS